ncbi:type II toxin-antitoxin system RelE/ParE family toxin [Sabulicella glaciei]|uniref:Type II toxin-antitoxin system RelE/ParE family toxin n=1 Tax=Sabulicella glaciei TaxID=2984948 RepID=A0ABT3NZS8_9PROT|nr:type II toxin-antitoxin system RelE/ParE family toxin [Roseococcus sp. MDT2-1-1]MCW8087605.1 type II toxin-antitoxin system RelE/ParE family toxin [Roseococcus sp. MDT2-1-1]
MLCNSITHTLLSRPEIRIYLQSDGTAPFEERLLEQEARAAARIDTALETLERGLRPDVRPVGEGVHEARIDYGPGYRVYFAPDGEALVILLLCGDKRTQPEDIETSKGLWKDYKQRRAAPPRDSKKSRGGQAQAPQPVSKRRGE